MQRARFVFLVVFGVLCCDQILKIWVKLNMQFGESIEVFGLDWFRLQFAENPGMAFGLQFGGSYGKLALSLFRIAVVGFLGYMLFRLVRERFGYAILLALSLIFAGALGNILDAAFYGLLFTSSGVSNHPDLAVFDPNNGYAPFLYGKVVDMFYFPIAQGVYPDWFPFWGGQPYQFFRPVFNLADASISMGVVLVLVYHKQLFPELKG